MLIAMLLLAGATLQEPAAESPAPAARPAHESLICKASAKTGSRVNFERICHTKAEWDLIHRENRAVVERGQQQQNRYDPVQGPGDSVRHP